MSPLENNGLNKNTEGNEKKVTNWKVLLSTKEGSGKKTQKKQSTSTGVTDSNPKKQASKAQTSPVSKAEVTSAQSTNKESTKVRKQRTKEAEEQLVKENLSFELNAEREEKGKRGKSSFSWFGPRKDSSKASKRNLFWYKKGWAQNDRERLEKFGRPEQADEPSEMASQFKEELTEKARDQYDAWLEKYPDATEFQRRKKMEEISIPFHKKNADQENNLVRGRNINISPKTGEIYARARETEELYEEAKRKYREYEVQAQNDPEKNIFKNKALAYLKGFESAKKARDAFGRVVEMMDENAEKRREWSIQDQIDWLNKKKGAELAKPTPDTEEISDYEEELRVLRKDKQLLSFPPGTQFIDESDRSAKKAGAEPKTLTYKKINLANNTYEFSDGKNPEPIEIPESELLTRIKSRELTSNDEIEDGEGLSEAELRHYKWWRREQLKFSEVRKKFENGFDTLVLPGTWENVPGVDQKVLNMKKDADTVFSLYLLNLGFANDKDLENIDALHNIETTTVKRQNNAMLMGGNVRPYKRVELADESKEEPKIPGAVYLNTGNKNGCFVEKTGDPKNQETTITIGKGGEEQRDESTTAVVYRMVNELGKLTDEKLQKAGWKNRADLERMVEFTKNISTSNYKYKIDGEKFNLKTFTNKWWKTGYGIQKAVSPEFLMNLFKEGYDPEKTFTKEQEQKVVRETRWPMTVPKDFIKKLPKDSISADGMMDETVWQKLRKEMGQEISTAQKEATKLGTDKVREFGVLHKVKLWEVCAQSRDLVEKSKDGIYESLDFMRNHGIKTNTTEFGLYSTLLNVVTYNEKTKKSWNKIPLGVVAAKALGFTTYINYNERDNIATIVKPGRDLTRVKEMMKEAGVEVKLIGGSTLVTMNPEKESNKMSLEKLVKMLKLNQEPKA